MQAVARNTCPGIWKVIVRTPVCLKEVRNGVRTTYFTSNVCIAIWDDMHPVYYHAYYAEECGRPEATNKNKTKVTICIDVIVFMRLPLYIMCRDIFYFIHKHGIVKTGLLQ